MTINPFFLFLLGFLVALFGKSAFGKWFNPVSFYSLIWGGMLGMHELRLIRYPDMSSETWLLIFSSWGTFTLGALTVLLIQQIRDEDMNSSIRGVKESSLIKVILLLCFLGSFGVVQHWLVLIKAFGSVASAIALGSIVFSARVRGELPGMVPYIADFVLAAISFTGVYLRLKHKVNWYVIVPLILISIEAMAWMGRAKVLIAGVLLFTSYSFSRFHSQEAKLSTRARWGLAISVAVIFILIAVASEGIRSVRKVNEQFYAASPTLNKLQKVPFLTPSIYVYVSGHVAVLDKFLHYQAENKGEKDTFGENTLAPLYRLIWRLTGEGYYIRTYASFYTVPIDLNTGTYLRDLYADFGETGALIFPYVLSFVTTLLYFSNRRNIRLWKIVLLSHLFVVIGFSFALQAMQWGYWWDSLIISLVVARILEKRVDYDHVAP